MAEFSIKAEKREHFLGRVFKHRQYFIDFIDKGLECWEVMQVRTILL